MCVIMYERTIQDSCRQGSRVSYRLESGIDGVNEVERKNLQEGIIGSAIREWSAVDLAAIFSLFLGVLLQWFGFGQTVVSFFLFGMRFIMALAIANRPRKWFVIAGAAAVLSSVVALCYRDASYGEFMVVCLSWVVFRLTLTLMRSLYKRITWMNVSVGTVFGWAALCVAYTMFIQGFSWLHMFTAFHAGLSCVGMFMNVYDNTAAECVLLASAIIAVYPFIPWYGLTMFCLHRFVRFQIGELLRSFGITFSVSVTASEIKGRVSPPVKALYEIASRSVDKITTMEWDSVAIADRGEKVVDVIRQYALLGDRFLALALETYCFERQMIPADIGNMRIQLLANKSMARVFDEQLAMYFPGMVGRSQARKATVFEALVGVSISQFSCFRDFESLLAAMADVVGKKHLVIGDAQWLNQSVESDSSFHISVLDNLYRTVSVDAFDWVGYRDLYCENSLLDRKFLKRLSRVGRAALEACYVLESLPEDNVSVMSDFIALKISEANVARVWRNLASQAECVESEISDKTASENMFALVAIMFQMGDYDVIESFAGWFESFVVDEGGTRSPK